MKLTTPEIGKYYRVRILGYDDIIVQYTESESHHCKSCTCRNDLYILVSGEKQISPGSHTVELLEEVKAPK